MHVPEEKRHATNAKVAVPIRFAVQGMELGVCKQVTHACGSVLTDMR